MNRYSYNIFKHKKITLDINRTEMIIENSLKYKEKNTLRIYTVHTFYILFNKQGDIGIEIFATIKEMKLLTPVLTNSLRNY